MSDLPNATAGELTELPTESPPRQNRRWLFVLLLLGLGSTVALTMLAGTAQTFALLLSAELFYVTLVALVQGLRYVAMAISTGTVAQIVGVRVPLPKLVQVVTAAQAANRTFVGGAAGMAIRLDFFMHRGMTAGTFVAVESVEDVVSIVAVGLLLFAGTSIVVASGAGAALRGDAVGAAVVGALALAAAVVAFVWHRAWVERLADAVARLVSRLLQPFLRRAVYDKPRVRRGVADFYAGLELARRDPVRVGVAFLCAVARLGCDAVALYFSFRAVGYDAAPGVVLVIFVVSSSVATLAAVPGQIGVMETTLALMSTAFGIPAPVAVSATLLYRLISFWLPIPFGYAFAWRMEQRGEL